MGEPGSAAALVEAVRAGLRAVADPDRAPAMQAYMKSAMPFLGVTSAQRRAVVRPLVRAAALSRREGEQAVASLWDGATYREERYAALDLLAAPGARGWHDADLLPLLRRLVVEGAWWDYVDDVAIHHVGPVLRTDRPVVTPVLLAWSTAADRWLRRAAVICQVGLAADLDRDLLARAVDANAADPDVFLRKGIGWALRSAARTDPEWVRSFVTARADRLSPLSRREALRHIREGVPH